MTLTHSSPYSAREYAKTLTDAELAEALRVALGHLARHSGEYATAVAHGPGFTVAGMIRCGFVSEASERGRDAMRLAYVRTVTAQTIPPGLDRNEFTDQLTGRENPRHRRVRELANTNRTRARAGHV